MPVFEAARAALGGGLLGRASHDCLSLGRFVLMDSCVQRTADLIHALPSLDASGGLNYSKQHGIHAAKEIRSQTGAGFPLSHLWRSAREQMFVDEWSTAQGASSEAAVRRS